MQRTRTYSLDADGKKIRRPKFVPDSENPAGEITVWTRFPGEIIRLQEFSDKIQLLSYKQILPIDVFIDFVREHLDEEFDETKIKEFDFKSFAKEQDLLRKEDRLKSKLILIIS